LTRYDLANLDSSKTTWLTGKKKYRDEIEKKEDEINMKKPLNSLIV